MTLCKLEIPGIFAFTMQMDKAAALLCWRWSEFWRDTQFA